MISHKAKSWTVGSIGEHGDFMELKNNTSPPSNFQVSASLVTMACQKTWSTWLTSLLPPRQRPEQNDHSLSDMCQTSFLQYNTVYYYVISYIIYYMLLDVYQIKITYGPHKAVAEVSNHNEPIGRKSGIQLVRKIRKSMDFTFSCFVLNWLTD